MNTMPNQIARLEAIEREYQQVRELLDAAARNMPLHEYAIQMVLYVQPDTGQIMEASAKGLALLGYTRDELCARTIDQVEIAGSAQGLTTYFESDMFIEVYYGRYRHQQGHELTMRVRRYVTPKNDQQLHCYMLEEQSLRATLWWELSRREDTDHQFREKLKMLHEISNELGKQNSFHDVCLQAIQLGIQKLGFDRMSLWFLDASKTMMTGSFGVDEAGNVRDEREQSWSFSNTYLRDFMNGRRDVIATHDNAPLYNEKSEIITYGWHLAAPLLDGDDFIGYLGADNFLHQQPMQSYQPELLRLYGATIGHLVVRQREQEIIRKLSSAVAHSSSMIAILNQKLIIEFVNDTFCRFSDCMLEDMIGQDLTAIFPKSEARTIEQILSVGQGWQGELVNRKKDGTPYEAFVSISLVRSGDTVENFVVVQEDITLLKQARQREIALQLEHDRAEMLETFVTDIGHEFKTPLTVIHTSNFIVGKTADEQKRQKHTEIIATQVDALTQMLNEVLDIVGLSRGVELEMAPVELDCLLETIVHDFLPALEQKQLEAEARLDSGVALWADGRKLARAINEIMENAIKYTPEHGRITMTLHRYPEEVGIAIQDSGIGIPLEEQEKIFHRFYRGDKARTSRQTGLGLAIAKLLIDAHNGRIEVHSSLGQGSTFEILLPLKSD